MAEGFTYEVQVDGGERKPFRAARYHQGLVTSDLLLKLFEHGVTCASLDIWQGDQFHLVKIWLMTNKPD